LEQERIAKIVLDAAFEVHSYLGPGLLESAYQTCLLGELKERGVFVESEKPLPVIYKGISIDCAYRIDILVERDKVLIENKSVKEIEDIHVAQLLSYLRLSGISLGFLFNFNVRSFKDGIRRIVLNDKKTFSTSRLHGRAAILSSGLRPAFDFAVKKFRVQGLSLLGG
jgi:GxxExxY protein